MDPNYYGVVEMIFSGSVVLGIGLWQLLSIQRELRRDREKATASAAPARPDER